MVIGQWIHTFGPHSLFACVLPSQVRGKAALTIVALGVLRTIFGRIRSEEAMLAAEFGDWTAYVQRTWRLVPLVW